MRTQIINITTIRAAFDRIKVLPSAFKAENIKAGAIIHDKLQTKAGIQQAPAWNANLSFKTAQHLDAPNFNPVRKNAQGEVVSIFRERAWSTGTYNKMCA